MREYKADRINVVAGMQQSLDHLYKEREEVWEYLYEAIKGAFQHGKPPMATFTLKHMAERAVLESRLAITELEGAVNKLHEERREAFELLGQAIADDVGPPDTLIERVKFIIECNKNNFDGCVAAQGELMSHLNQLRPYLRGKALQKVKEGSTVTTEVANELATAEVILGGLRAQYDSDTFEYGDESVSIGDLCRWIDDELRDTHRELNSANERITSARRRLGGLIEGLNVQDTLEAYIDNLWQQYHAKRALSLVRMWV